MTATGPNDSSARMPEVMTWHVDTARRLLFIDVASGVTDSDLTKRVPMIWKEHPDIIWFNVVVDHNHKNETGNWSWNGLLAVADEWRAYAQGRNPGKRVAIVTENYWITQLVNSAFGSIFPGQEFKCFADHADAPEWALAGPRAEMQ